MYMLCMLYILHVYIHIVDMRTVYIYMVIHTMCNHFDGGMVSMLASRVVDCEYRCQTKDYEIGICCFFVKMEVLRWEC